MLMQHEPEPTDSNAVETLIDAEYTRGLVAYNRRFEAITGSIWEDRYLHRRAAKDELFAPLPDVPVVEETEVHQECECPEEPDHAPRSESTSVPV